MLRQFPEQAVQMAVQMAVLYCFVFVFVSRSLRESQPITMVVAGRTANEDGINLRSCPQQVLT
jgi:hypothetical protein